MRQVIVFREPVKNDLLADSLAEVTRLVRTGNQPLKARRPACIHRQSEIVNHDGERHGARLPQSDRAQKAVLEIPKRQSAPS